jgi:ribose transport system substrate-binding protein
MIKSLLGGMLAATALSLLSTAAMAEPEVVSGPAGEPECFAAWSADTPHFKFPKKEGPFRIALANGYIANTWRIQMIQTAKAYAAQPEVAAKLKEFKVVSTGEDVPAQISAINNFIDAGYDAIVFIAESADAMVPVAKRAEEAGVLLVAYAGTVDNSEDLINVNVDQEFMGYNWAQWLIKNIPDGGKILEVRGPAGNPEDAARHAGVMKAFEASGKPFEVISVIGEWSDPVAQKVTADAIVTSGPFDGITGQGGDTGIIQAMKDTAHPWVPFGGEMENGFRKACGEFASQGLLCQSAGSGPAQVAVAMKVAIDALKGNVVPQYLALPLSSTEHPDFKDGVNYFSDGSDNFFVGNSYPTCGIDFDAQEILGQTGDDS